jgi:hypothetical protein
MVECKKPAWCKMPKMCYHNENGDFVCMSMTWSEWWKVLLAFTCLYGFLAVFWVGLFYIYTSGIRNFTQP